MVFSTSLQLPARDHAIGFGGGAAGIATPERDSAYAKHNNDEGRSGDRNRLSAETRDGAGTPGGEFDHATPNPDVILKFQISIGQAALKPGILPGGRGIPGKTLQDQGLGLQEWGPWPTGDAPG